MYAINHSIDLKDKDEQLEEILNKYDIKFLLINTKWTNDITNFMVGKSNLCFVDIYKHCLVYDNNKKNKKGFNIYSEYLEKVAELNKDKLLQGKECFNFKKLGKLRIYSKDSKEFYIDNEIFGNNFKRYYKSLSLQDFYEYIYKINRDAGVDKAIVYIEDMSRIDKKMQNKLLKGFEETKKMLIIATFENYSDLLDTMLSRAVVVDYKHQIYTNDLKQVDVKEVIGNLFDVNVFGKGFNYSNVLNSISNVLNNKERFDKYLDFLFEDKLELNSISENLKVLNKLNGTSLTITEMLILLMILFNKKDKKDFGAYFLIKQRCLSLLTNYGFELGFIEDIYKRILLKKGINFIGKEGIKLFI